MKRLILILILLITTTYLRTENTIEDQLITSKDELLNMYFSQRGIYTYDVEDYFRTPAKNTFKLSPNGIYLSFMKTDYEGKDNLFVKNTETGEVKRVVDAGRETITDYCWAKSNRLIYLKTKGDFNNYEALSIGTTGRHKKRIITFTNQHPRLVDILEEKKGSAIIEIREKNSTQYKPYILNALTGYLKKIDIPNIESKHIYKYLFDKKGLLKAYIINSSELENQLYYKSIKTGNFEAKSVLNWKTEFNIIDFDYTTSNPNDAFVLTNIKSNTTELVRYDLEQDRIIETLHTNKKYDIEYIESSASMSHDIDYYYYTSDKLHIIPTSRRFKKVYKKFKKQFKDKNHTIINISENENKYLIHVSDDRIYGLYYTYDTLKDEFKMIINTMPHLKENNMGSMHHISLASRDGLDLNCYLSLPIGSIKGSNIPLIVKPHANPFGARDTWGFEPESQLFASRGYATLHVNYRGTKGYGNKFKSAGYKQTGRKILEDIEDAINHVLSSGIIDKNRIAIYGEEFGGLTAVESMINKPDLFKCGVNKSGPSSIVSVFENLPDDYKAYLPKYYEQYYDLSDPKERTIAQSVSPINNADKITIPLLMVQSKDASAQNIDDTKSIVRNMKQRNIDVFLILTNNDARDFKKNEIEFYKSLLGFFAKYLK